MNRLHTMFFAFRSHAAASGLIALLFLMTMSGCGGGNNLVPSGAGQSRATGRATFTVLWPAPSRLIPNAANSITLVLSRGGSPPVARTVPRPAGDSAAGPQTTIEFADLPLGTYTATATAFPSVDGSGVAQASASVPVTVVPDQNAPITLTMNSTIVALELAPTTGPNLRIGVTRQLATIARDAANNVVLTTPSKITFTSSAPGVATVSATGLVTTTGLGTATITATDAESGRVGTATITVVPVGLSTTAAWSKFHGNAQNTGRAVGGSPTAGTQRWVFPATGAIGSVVFSSPAIGADGTVYVGAHDNNLYAINPDGTEKWRFATRGRIESSPAIGVDGTIYVGSLDNNVYAVNGATGAEVWRFAASGPVYGPPAIGPDGTIYIGATTVTGATGSDNRLYALDSLSGAKRWEFVAGGGIQTAPALSADATRVYVGSLDNKVYAINTADGTLAWSFPTRDAIFSSPAVAPDGTLYLGSNDGRLYAINANGTQRWVYDAEAPVYSSPAIGADGTVYFGVYDNASGLNNNRVVALNGATGVIRTGWPVVVGGFVESSPVIGADGTIYIGCYDNSVYALNPNGTQKWRFQTGDAVGSSPAIGADGTLYVGGYDGKVYAIR